MWEQGRSLDDASSRTLAPGSILWFPRAADGFPSLWQNNRQKELKLGGEVCFDSVSNHDGQEGRVESTVVGGVARPPLVLVNKEAECQAETLKNLQRLAPTGQSTLSRDHIPQPPTTALGWSRVIKTGTCRGHFTFKLSQPLCAFAKTRKRESLSRTFLLTIQKTL